MKKLLYFAYGSNLLQERLNWRIGKSIYIGNHVLDNYKLVFNCKGFANITPSNGSKVEGSLYTITPDQLSELNFYEGLYNTEFFDYKDYTVVVYTAKQAAVKRFEYFQPERIYLDVIIEGMLEKKININYKEVVELRKSLYPSKKKLKRVDRIY